MNIKKLFQDNQLIETDSILLRPVQKKDANGLLRMYSDVSIYQYRPGLPKTSIELVNKAIDRFRNDMQKKEGVAFTLFGKKTNEIIGLVELFHLEIRIEQIEIGYTIIPAFSGYGFATEAIGCMTNYLIFDIGFNRVCATTHVDNMASQKALLKNGYCFEGKKRQGEFWQGLGFVDICQYAKLKADYIN